MDTLSMTTLWIVVGAQVTTFLVLALLLRKLVVSASARELKRLRNLSLENQKKAEQLAKELETAEREHQRRVEKAESELRELKDSIRQDSEVQKDKLLREARAEGDKIVSQALKAKDRIRQDLEGEMQDRCIDLACRLIKAVLTEERMKWFHDGLLDDILGAIRDVDSDALQRTRDGAVADVRTPYALTAEQLGKFAETLSAKAGKQLATNQVLDPNVVAGVVIGVDNIVIDGSLGGKLQQVAATVVSDAEEQE